MPTEHSIYDTNSREAQEIMAKIPMRSIRIGSFVLLLLMITVLASTSFITLHETHSEPVSFHIDSLKKVRLKMNVRYAIQVKVNEPVLIKLNAFPSTTHGLLKGSIDSIVFNPNDSMAYIQLNLSSLPYTNTGKELPSTILLNGEVEFMTGESTVFKKIFKIHS